jgi:E3 ubiquitin-protein ligase HERC4
MHLNRNCIHCFISGDVFFCDLQSFETPEMYGLIGVLCGLAIYNFTIIDISLPLALYKKLLDRSVMTVTFV